MREGTFLHASAGSICAIGIEHDVVANAGPRSLLKPVRVAITGKLAEIKPGLPQGRPYSTTFSVTRARAGYTIFAGH